MGMAAGNANSVSQGEIGTSSVQNTIPYNNIVSNQVSGPVTLTMNAAGVLDHKISNISLPTNSKGLVD